MTSTDEYLPPPLMTSEDGSFAQKTILERKPAIIKKVIADHTYPADIVNALEQFTREIATEPIAPLKESVKDSDFWHGHWSRFAGKTWLEVPWYFAETYFYRRLLEITKYFQPGDFFHQDPFLPQKVNQENAALEQLADYYVLMYIFGEEEHFAFLVHAALWGNRSDLSNFTVQETSQQGKGTVALRKFILIDHSQAVYDYLHAGLTHVAFINDNVGADCLNDLLLADFLLQQDWVEVIDFHLKDRPFFVSDAMPADIERLVQKMQAMPKPLQGFGNRLDAWLKQGKLQLKTDPYWTSCLTFYHLPDHLQHELAQADLIILKGDVNYRRLLDDRHWAPTTDISEVSRNFPKPFLILRTLKGEIIVSLGEGQAEAIAAQDPTWLINGKRGLIQLVGT